MTVRSQATPNRGRKQATVAPEVPEDALRTMLQSLIQETLEREVTQFLGAAPHERSVARRRWRNGSRDRTLLTRVGPLTLKAADGVDLAGEPRPLAHQHLGGGRIVPEGRILDPGVQLIQAA